MIIEKIKKHKIAILCSITYLILGMLFGRLPGPMVTPWYENLTKPFFQPPGWIFGPVWTILYIMLGIVGVKISQSKNKVGKILFILKTILLFAWPAIFSLQNLAISSITLAIIWLISLTIILISKDKTIKYMLLPYFAWISFATILSYNIWILNA